MMTHPELRGTSFIGASDRGNGGAGTLLATNPASGEQLEPAYQLEPPATAARAAELAAKAFSSFRNSSGAERAALLREIADRIDRAEEAIVARMNAETGLPEPRCRGEKARTCGQLRLFADLVEEGSWAGARIDHAQPEREPLPRPDLRSMQRPLGPVAVFGASNFPLAFSGAGGDTASALAAGCPVVVKAHSAHPGTSELVAAAVSGAVVALGLHPGVFSLLYADGVELGQAIVQHPCIKAVGFTGSRSGGRALMDLAAARPEPIPVYAEMSSVNPVIVLPAAMRERGEAIARDLVASLTLGVGQFCTKPGIILAPDDGFDAFARVVADRASAVPAGTMLHAGICQSYHAGVQNLAKIEGATQLVAVAAPADSNQAGCVVFATDAEHFLNEPSLSAEIFGPASVLVRCASPEEFVRVAESLEGQLTGSIHGSDQDFSNYADLISAMESKVGRIVINGFPTGVEVAHAMVHGGPYPASSDGRSTSVGTLAIERFTRPVSWQDCPDALLPEALQEANPHKIWRLVDGDFSQMS